MKALYRYIFEALDFTKFIGVFFNYYKQLKKKEALQETIGKNLRQICINPDPYQFNQINSDESLAQMINDEEIGMELMTEFLKSPEKFHENASKYNLNTYFFGYKQHNSKTKQDELYFIGMIVTNPQIANIENYLNVVIADTIKCIPRPKKVLLEMFRQLGEKIYMKNSDFVGFSFKTKNKNLKSLLVNSGFSQTDVNEEIYAYKMK